MGNWVPPLSPHIPATGWIPAGWVPGSPPRLPASQPADGYPPDGYLGAPPPLFTTIRRRMGTRRMGTWVPIPHTHPPPGVHPGNLHTQSFSLLLLLLLLLCCCRFPLQFTYDVCFCCCCCCCFVWECILLRSSFIAHCSTSANLSVVDVQSLHNPVHVPSLHTAFSK